MGEEKVLISYKIVREDLTHEVIFEQSHKGNEGMNSEYLTNRIYDRNIQQYFLKLPL